MAERMARRKRNSAPIRVKQIIYTGFGRASGEEEIRYTYVAQLRGYGQKVSAKVLKRWQRHEMR